MSAAILNQPWEDVADDVTGAIEKAVQPLLKKAVDDIYSGLLDATQDYLKGNLAFNIASRIDCAEREASTARQRVTDLTAALERTWEVLHMAGLINLSGGVQLGQVSWFVKISDAEKQSLAALGREAAA